MANNMNHEPDAPEFNQDFYSDFDFAHGVPEGVDLHKIVDTVRACSFIMNEIAHKNHELKIIAETKISDLQSDLLSERKKSLEFREEFNELTRKLHANSINTFEQVNSLKAEIKELKEANANLSLQNLFLEDELRKAKEWLELIYSTTAAELKFTLDELEKAQQINFISKSTNLGSD